ncbi:MAG: SagB/ThcOx family dehydrogenase [Chloroflexota bacterium]
MRESLWQRNRQFLKDDVRLTIDFSQTDQSRGLPPPPLEKPFAPDARRIDLLQPADWGDVGHVDLLTAIRNRRSRRRYLPEPLSLAEVSFLLWATQGVTRVLQPGTALRTVPSAGSRHALETYLCVLAVEGLERGIYRYLPVEHQMVLESTPEDLPSRLAAATLGQPFTGKGAVTFVWTAIPYRMEWRYDLAAHKVIAVDAGHVCQNLYLAVEAIGAGTCAVAAYNQRLMDVLLGVDGEDEFTIYLAPVGKVGGG